MKREAKFVTDIITGDHAREGNVNQSAAELRVDVCNAM